MEEEGVGVSGAEVVGTSDLLPLTFLGPLKVTIGSSKFLDFLLSLSLSLLLLTVVYEGNECLRVVLLSALLRIGELALHIAMATGQNLTTHAAKLLS